MSHNITLNTEESQEALWQDFVEKSTVAQKSHNFNDGQAARQAWMRFMGIGGDNHAAL
ncbi:MAG: hypothetical protein JKY45_05685 [Emcibacter sp.]|nr:hypothetical protein [Emcibacter sp.]